MPNPEAWLKLAITNMMINRAKKLKHRPPTMRGLDAEEIEAIGLGVDKRSFSSQLTMPIYLPKSLNAWARPADWNVHKYRFGFPDALMSDIDLSKLRQAVDWGFKQWQQGDRVLVRCQAGLNRSGLVTALILMKSGMSAEQAIHIIREKRAEVALCNMHYERWLINEGFRFINHSSNNLPASA